MCVRYVLVYIIQPEPNLKPGKKNLYKFYKWSR